MARHHLVPSVSPVVQVRAHLAVFLSAQVRLQAAEVVLLVLLSVKVIADTVMTSQSLLAKVALMLALTVDLFLSQVVSLT